MSAILPRPILPRFARASFPFPSPSDACKAGYLLHDRTLFVIGQKTGWVHPTRLITCKTRTTRHFVTKVFPRLAPAACAPLVFSLIGPLPCLRLL